MPTPLDNPVWECLIDGHSSFAERLPSSARYRRGVNPIGAVREDDAGAWRELATLVEPDEVLYTGRRTAFPLPDCWALEKETPMLQMVLGTPAAPVSGEFDAVELGEADVSDADLEKVFLNLTTGV